MPPVPISNGTAGKNVNGTTSRSVNHASTVVLQGGNTELTNAEGVPLDHTLNNMPTPQCNGGVDNDKIQQLLDTLENIGTDKPTSGDDADDDDDVSCLEYYIKL